MDLDNTDLINNAGLNSLSGFSYQIKVFILRLTQIHQGQCVEFETLDDVAVRFLPDKDSISDSCFKWSIDENFDAEVFQVKQTKFLIHGKNGRIQSADSHGGDPFPPKG